MSLLPLRGESTADPDEPRVVGLAGDEADETFEVLSSGTTRKVLAALYEQPSTPSEVRDQIGTSLQNVHYHLGKLEDADLIEPAGVGYSEKGTEMTVYAPTSEAIVLFAGRRDDRSRLRSMLSRVFGVVLALGVATAALRWFVQSQTGGAAFDSAESGGGAASSQEGADGEAGGASGASGDADTGGGAAAETDGVSIAATEEPSAADVATDGGVEATTQGAERATDAAAGGSETVVQQAADVLAGDPALAFLLGGLFVLLAVGLVWYTTR
ncbi:ArsR/SmtB family transcription factor [Halomarina oriensis]|uniref:Helix-turn-helix domain-containing protein n=1 Tax=Halomarina oriensis TaxID=671145 RepID=A0A6B0GRV0_9EURY|nr:helix-turn-helix domain-containing protein [Halomarina oriensis]MWG36037.1 helix-turn-helix domain-containing protein [Halomarina oriensis]